MGGIGGVGFGCLGFWVQGFGRRVRGVVWVQAQNFRPQYTKQ